MFGFLKVLEVEGGESAEAEGRFVLVRSLLHDGLIIYWYVGLYFFVLMFKYLAAVGLLLVLALAQEG